MELTPIYKDLLNLLEHHTVLEKHNSLFVFSFEKTINTICSELAAENHTDFSFRDSFFQFLETNYPKISSFLNEIKSEEHEDYWVEAKKGDIVMKTGRYYESSVPNGYHFIAREDGGDIECFNSFGSSSWLCYPEEYKIVGNLNEKISDYLLNRQNEVD